MARGRIIQEHASKPKTNFQTESKLPDKRTEYQRDLSECDKHQTQMQKTYAVVDEETGVDGRRQLKSNVNKTIPMPPSDPDIDTETNELCITGCVDVEHYDTTELEELEGDVGSVLSSELEELEGAVGGVLSSELEELEGDVEGILSSEQEELEGAVGGVLSSELEELEGDVEGILSSEQEELEGAVGGVLSSELTLGSTSTIRKKTTVRQVSRTFSLDEHKNQINQNPGDTCSLPDDEDSVVDDYKDQFRKTKRHSLDKHQSKTNPITACNDSNCEVKGCFRPENCQDSQEHQKHKEEVENYCKERCGTIWYNDGRDWKPNCTCIHLGGGLLATCRHGVEKLIEENNWNEKILGTLLMVKFPNGSQFMLEDHSKYWDRNIDLVLLELITGEDKSLPLSFELKVQDPESSAEELLYVYGAQDDKFELCFSFRAVKPSKEHFHEAENSIKAHFGLCSEDNTRHFPQDVDKYDMYLFCGLIHSASGGAIVSWLPSGRIILEGMYVGGHPKYFYHEERTYQQLKDFPQCYKIEKGLLASCTIQAIEKSPYDISVPGIMSLSFERSS